MDSVGRSGRLILVASPTAAEFALVAGRDGTFQVPGPGTLDVRLAVPSS